MIFPSFSTCFVIPSLVINSHLALNPPQHRHHNIHTKGQPFSSTNPPWNANPLSIHSSWPRRPPQAIDLPTPDRPSTTTTNIIKKKIKSKTKSRSVEREADRERRKKCLKWTVFCFLWSSCGTRRKWRRSCLRLRVFFMIHR